MTNSLSSFSEAQRTCRESNAQRPERKANRLFTFSSRSAAKISPGIKVDFFFIFWSLLRFVVSQPIVGPSSPASQTPCHSTPLGELGSALDAVFQPEETKKVKPIRKIQECAAGMSKDQGAKPKLPQKPRDTLLLRTSNPRNLTFNLRNVKVGRMSKKLTCNSLLRLTT